MARRIKRRTRYRLDECFRCEQPCTRLELTWWTWRHVQLCPECVELGRVEDAYVARSEATTVVTIRREEAETRPLVRPDT